MAPRADGHALRPPALQMITRALSPEQPLGRCRLIHHGSWAAFVAALPPSVSMLELNSFAAQMELCSAAGSMLSDIVARMTGTPLSQSLDAAFTHVASNCADEWVVKSWDGVTAHHGVVPGCSHGFAMTRRHA